MQEGNAHSMLSQEACRIVTLEARITLNCAHSSRCELIHVLKERRLQACIWRRGLVPTGTAKLNSSGWTVDTRAALGPGSETLTLLSGAGGPRGCNRRNLLAVCGGSTCHTSIIYPCIYIYIYSLVCVPKCYAILSPCLLCMESLPYVEMFARFSTPMENGDLDQGTN